MTMLHGGHGGDDMIFGGRGDDDLYGGMGNDSLWGGPGVDDFYGGPGNDMIYADEEDIEGNATIDGGENMEGMAGDMDTVSFEKLVDEEIIIVLGTDTVDVENVIGTDEDDTITGENATNTENNTIDPADTANNNRPNEIEGGDGGDILAGGDGGRGYRILREFRPPCAGGSWRWHC